MARRGGGGLNRDVRVPGVGLRRGGSGVDRRGRAERRGGGWPAGTGGAPRSGAGQRFGPRAGGGALAAGGEPAGRRGDSLRGRCRSVRRARHGADGGGVSRRRDPGLPQRAGAGPRRRPLALLPGAPAARRRRARRRGRALRGGAPTAAGRHGDSRLARGRPVGAGRCGSRGAAVPTGPAALSRFPLRTIRAGARGPDAGGVRGGGPGS